MKNNLKISKHNRLTQIQKPKKSTIKLIIFCYAIVTQTFILFLIENIIFFYPKKNFKSLDKILVFFMRRALSQYYETSEAIYLVYKGWRGFDVLLGSSVSFPSPFVFDSKFKLNDQLEIKRSCFDRELAFCEVLRKYPLVNSLIVKSILFNFFSFVGISNLKRKNFVLNPTIENNIPNTPNVQLKLTYTNLQTRQHFWRDIQI
ncbi:hypothetical protein BpHYR1_008641 [Brachionus plicatilis]|uniref:Transmembrane protein n=1 Tax=Brachionus plicatilis TaxID=10195 RepID=A0A3M7T9Z2_BRAPC|nr:hypothetical protein BpHYR1_008641 [Brachionus plicatilis]